MKAISIIFAALFVCALATEAPIIGLYTLPIINSNGKSTSFVQAEAVKFIEASGGRVVPLIYTKTHDELIALLKQCNGLFIPSYNEESEHTNILDAQWHQNFQSLFTEVLAMNTNGIVFPIWISGSSVSAFFGPASMDTVFLSNYNTPLSWQENFQDVISSKNIQFPTSKAYFNVDKAFTKSTITRNPVSTRWIIDATSVDERGISFISLFHHPLFPFYASIAQFEAIYNFYPMNMIDHSRKATRFAYGFSKFFTDLARMNDNTFGSVEAEYTNNIWNKWTPTISSGYEEIRFYFN